MPTEPQPLTQTARTTVRRKRERGSHDRDLIDAILDEGLVAHVGFCAEHGPVVLPMVYARIGDAVYLHGAAANDLLRNLVGGAPVCFTVTLIDGIVLARSAFHHSMNYRSAVLFGSVSRVVDPEEMAAASIALLEHLVAGRGGDARLPTAAELRSTLIVRLPIVEGSAKVRTGGPVDDDEDLDLPHWAGVVPVATVAAPPVPDQGWEGRPVPAYLRTHRLVPGAARQADGGDPAVS